MFYYVKQSITAIPKEGKIKSNSGFLNMIGVGANLSASSDLMDVLVTEVKQPVAKDICALKLTSLSEFKYIILYFVAR